MDLAAKQEFTRKRAIENEDRPQGDKILWSRHGIVELVNENWTRIEIEKGLLNCVVIEDYPTEHRVLPDCLVLGYLSDREPFHAVVAIDQTNERLLMVTVYSPSVKEWEDDWKTRKK